VEHLDEILERLQEIRKELDLINEKKKQDDKHRQDTSEN
jgi:hypothetical protein